MYKTSNRLRFNITQYLFTQCDDKNKTAFFTVDDAISYFELEKKVKVAASSLQQNRVLCGERVVISLYDGLPLIVIFLACLAVGACPIVINPRLASKSLLYILEDSRPVLLFFEAENFIFVREMANLKDRKFIPRLISTMAIEEIQGIEDFLLLGDTCWNNYCYQKVDTLTFMQYTSGTTGGSKGVMHSSQSILTICDSFAKKHLRITHADILYSTSKMFFGYGLGNSLFFTLSMGASAVLDYRWPNSKNIVENIKRFSPTVLFAVPSVYESLYDEEITWYKSSNIRLFFSSGSQLSEGLQCAWEQKYNTKIYNGFGATEMCHVFITNDKENFKFGSCGKIVDGYEYKLIDLEFKPIEISSNQQGLLHIKGSSMALGYWDNEQLSQFRFIDNYFCTNDIFSCDKDGFFYYHGRKDDLFKIKGRWVVPSQIEIHIKKNFSQIKDAFLVSGFDGLHMKAVLFLIGTVKNKTIKRAIFESIKENFESYQIPSKCIFLKELPLNDNGKVLRGYLSKQASDLLLKNSKQIERERA